MRTTPAARFQLPRSNSILSIWDEGGSFKIFREITIPKYTMSRHPERPTRVSRGVRLFRIPLSRKLIASSQFKARRSANKQIAGHLSITERTVKTHEANIFKKLEVSHRSEAVTKAISQGIICNSWRIHCIGFYQSLGYWSIFCYSNCIRNLWSNSCCPVYFHFKAINSQRRITSNSDGCYFGI